MTSNRYEFVADLYQRQYPNQHEPVFLGRDALGRHLMVARKRLAYGPTDPTMVLMVKKPDALFYEPPDLPIIPGRHVNTAIEEAVARHLDRLGHRPSRNLDRLPGRPDFWVPHPRPIIIQAHGCRLHGHGCKLIAADVLPEEDLLARRSLDRRHAGEWAELGVPTIVVWECSLVGPAMLDPQAFGSRLDQAIRLAAACNIEGDWQ